MLHVGATQLSLCPAAGTPEASTSSASPAAGKGSGEARVLLKAEKGWTESWVGPPASNRAPSGGFHFLLESPVSMNSFLLT